VALRSSDVAILFISLLPSMIAFVWESKATFNPSNVSATLRSSFPSEERDDPPPPGCGLSERLLEMSSPEPPLRWLGAAPLDYGSDTLRLFAAASALLRAFTFLFWPGPLLPPIGWEVGLSVGSSNPGGARNRNTSHSGVVQLLCGTSAEVLISVADMCSFVSL